MSAAVVAGSDCSETFLASGLLRLKVKVMTRIQRQSALSTHIPDLEFDRFAIELNRSDLKVNTDGADVAFCVGVIGEP